MKKFYAIIFLCCFSLSTMAWNNNDTFVTGGIQYLVTDARNYIVRTNKVSDESIIKDGVVTIPHKITDPKDSSKEFTVASVRFYEGGKLPSTVKKLVISEGITKLESLWQSNSLEEVVIPSTLTTYAHPDVYTLKKYTVDPANQYFQFIYEDKEKDDYAGFLTSKDGKTYYYHVNPSTNIYGKDGRITIPNNVETIGTNVLGTNDFIKIIKLGSSVTTFKSNNSPNLHESFEVEEGNTVFAAYDGALYKWGQSENTYLLNAFPRNKRGDFTVWEKCSILKGECLMNARITSIDLNKVKTVEYNAWRFASSLKKVIMGPELIYFRNSQSGNNLTIFEFKNDAEKTAEDKANSTNHDNFNLIDGALFSKDNKTLIAMPSGLHNGERYEVPSGVTKLEEYSLHYSYIKDFVSNAELTTLGSNVFTYSQLVSANFSASTDLTAISGLNSSTKLTSVTLSPGVQTFGGVSGCKSLVEIHVPNGSKLYRIDSNALKDLTSLKKFVFDGTCIADQLTIGERAFSGCTSLEELVFPTNIYSIGESAFAQCTNLKTVTFTEPSKITNIGTGAFADSNITDLVLPASVKSIGKEAFRSCTQLKTIFIPAATTNIHYESFKYCDNLTDINVSEENTVYSSIDGYLLTKDKETLAIFPTGKANDRFTLLPPAIKKIGDYAFYACERLTNVTIPNKVTAIGGSAFGLCKNLNTITFLCDEMIDPANICMDYNLHAFDDSMYGNITLNVRSDMYETYKNNEFYQKFKAIQSSFRLDNKNEYIATSDKAVDLLDVKESAHTYVVPETITYEGKTYFVSLMGDYACQNAPTSIKEIVMFTNVEYIGAKAFKQTESQSIENLFFVQKNPTRQLLSTTRFKLTPDDLPLVDGHKDNQYKEFADNMKIYVRKSAYDTCISDWAAYKDMIDYKIKDLSISTKYGTFAREFDVDLSDCLVDNGKQVVAFTAALTPVTEGPGDYGESEYSILMQSIYVGQDGDGTYIPKNTGVLLKVMDDESTNNNNYYTISDRNDDNLTKYSGDNAMKGVTVDNESIATSASNSIYVMQGGQFRYVNPTSTPSLTMPIHKAYLQIDSTVGSKLRFVFNDNTTDVVNVINNEIISADTPIHNLAGQRVTNSHHGIIIVNGKKYIK